MIRTSPQRPVGQPARRPSAARPKASALPRARTRASRAGAVLLALLAACAAGPKPAPPAPSAPLFRPEAGARITGSIEIAPGDWLLPAGEGEAALVVEGLEGAVLDLGGASLRGAVLGQDLDEFQGVGLLLRGCRDVVVRNGSLGGWKACIAVEGSSGVVLEDLSFDGWYGMRLRSSVAAEDGAAAARADPAGLRLDADPAHRRRPTPGAAALAVSRRAPRAGAPARPSRALG